MRSIKSAWLSALRRYSVIIRWQFYRGRSSRQIAPSILFPRSSPPRMSTHPPSGLPAHRVIGIVTEDLENQHFEFSNFNLFLNSLVNRIETVWSHFQGAEVREPRNTFFAFCSIRFTSSRLKETCHFRNRKKNKNKMQEDFINERLLINFSLSYFFPLNYFRGRITFFTSLN